MLKPFVIAVVLVVFMSASFLSAAPAARAERILKHLPAAVQQTIRAQLEDGKLSAIEKNDDNGDTSYDVEMVSHGKTRSFTVGSDGELLDVEVFLEELPPAVQQAIKTKAGSAAPDEIDKSDGETGTSYSVDITSNGKSRTFTVDATGKLMDEQVWMTELPGVLQKAVQKEIGAGTPEEITRSFDSGETLYDVDVAGGGKTQTLTFDSNGALLSRQEETPLSALPDAAQKQIQTLSAGGKLVAISKVTEQNVISFDVDVRQSGKLKSYTVDPDGKLLVPGAN
jgi:uncharacterized membrane protein YkoI